MHRYVRTDTIQTQQAKKQHHWQKLHVRLWLLKIASRWLLKIASPYVMCFYIQHSSQLLKQEPRLWQIDLCCVQSWNLALDTTHAHLKWSERVKQKPWHQLKSWQPSPQCTYTLSSFEGRWVMWLQGTRGEQRGSVCMMSTDPCLIFKMASSLALTTRYDILLLPSRRCYHCSFLLLLPCLLLLSAHTHGNMLKLW